MFSNEAENQIYANDIRELELFFKNEFGLQLYVAYGTLLGIVRENNFIVYDNDIDLAYISNYRILADVVKERKALESECRKRDMLYAPNKKTMGLKLKYKKSSFDLWYSYVDDKNYYLQPYGLIGPKEVLFPLKSQEFKGSTVKLPNNSPAILESVYYNWQKPLNTNFKKPRR